MSEPIPVILCGKRPEFAKKVVAALYPKIDVIHCCCTAKAAAAEISQVLEKGAEVKPSSGVGSNMNRTGAGPRPVFIMAGGGFNEDEFQLARNAAEINKSLAWMKADMSTFPKEILQKGPPPLEFITSRVFASVDEHGITADTRTPADAIWYW